MPIFAELKQLVFKITNNINDLNYQITSDY